MEPAARSTALAPAAGPGAAQAVPVTLIAGFLGSGKTTLLNRLLAGRHGLRVGVIVNDFGSLNIDSRLVAAHDGELITLDNGCICCSLAGDLVAQLVRLVEVAPPLEHVFIETSGVSDPGGILFALRDRHLRSLARIDSVVTLVDAAEAGSIPRGHLELARRQLAAADVIVFNKADLVSPDELAALHERLSHPRARWTDAVQADVPLEILIGAHVPREHPDGAGEGAAGHHAAISTWTWTFPGALDARGVRDVLASLPSSVFRAKGFLHLADAAATSFLVNVVGRRVDLRPFGEWGDAERRTELVFIGLEGVFDTDRLEARLVATAA